MDAKKSNIFYRIWNAVVNLIAALESTSSVLAIQASLKEVELDKLINDDPTKYEAALKKLVSQKKEISENLKIGLLAIAVLLIPFIIIF